MRIVAVRDIVTRIGSQIANAYIDFSAMTANVLAIVTALNIAVGLGLGGNESDTDVFAPFGGFADQVPVQDSRVAMPDIPGIGFEAKQVHYEVMQPLEQD